MTRYELERHLGKYVEIVLFDGRVIGWNTSECSKMRSKTPVGVAEAMAEQWTKES